VNAHAKWIRGVASSPDGKIVVSVADDMQTKLWNAETGEALLTLSNHQVETPHHYPSMLYAVAISPDGKLLATGDKVGHIVVSNLAHGKKLAELEAPVMYTWDPVQRRHSIGGIRSLAFSADNKLLAVGGMGKVNNIDHLEGTARVEVFDWQAGKQTHEFPGDRAKGLVERLLFHPAGEWLLAAGGDNGGFMHFFDLAAGKPLHQTTAPMHVHSLVPNEDGTTLYSVGNERLVVWELKS
jgi:WD40 repeat protein